MARSVTHIGVSLGDLGRPRKGKREREKLFARALQGGGGCAHMGDIELGISLVLLLLGRTERVDQRGVCFGRNSAGDARYLVW